jgi:hypothetical protein
MRNLIWRGNITITITITSEITVTKLWLQDLRCWNFEYVNILQPVTVAERSKA